MSDFRVPPRDEITQKFSTFLFRVENSQGRSRYAWVSESPLARNIRRYQKQELVFEKFCQSGDENSLVQYFLEIWKNDANPESERQLAKQHLAAYLEEPRYQAVRSRFRTFHGFEAPDETWEHYLYIAGCLTNNPDKIGSIYKKYKPHDLNLEKHFQLELASQIRDIFYQETGRGKYSPWYSLKKASDPKLKQGLCDLGVDPLQIDCYLKAKDCLFEVYSKSTRGWIEPTVEQYQAAADYYNRHYLQPQDSEGSLTSPISCATMKKWIQTCLKGLQSSPKIYHLDSYEDPSAIQYSSFSENLMTRDPLITLESQNFAEKLEKYKDELNAFLVNKLKEFEEQDNNRVMLMLRYGLAITQKRIEEETGIEQSQVSRRCQRFPRVMLCYTAEWVKNRLAISLEKTEHLENYLLTWIEQHYQFYVHSVLMTSFQQLDDRDLLILQLFYGQKVEKEEISEQCQITPKEVVKKLKMIGGRLQDDAIEWYRDNLNVCLDKDKKKIQAAIEQWLKQVSYANIR